MTPVLADANICLSAGVTDMRRGFNGLLQPRRGSVLDPHKAFIMGLIDGQADITLAEMADALRNQHDLGVDPSTIWYFLKRHGVTYKKRQRTPARKSGQMC